MKSILLSARIRLAIMMIGVCGMMMNDAFGSSHFGDDSWEQLSRKPARGKQKDRSFPEIVKNDSDRHAHPAPAIAPGPKGAAAPKPKTEFDRRVEALMREAGLTRAEAEQIQRDADEKNDQERKAREEEARRLRQAEENSLKERSAADAEQKAFEDAIAASLCSAGLPLIPGALSAPAFQGNVPGQRPAVVTMGLRQLLPHQKIQLTAEHMVNLHNLIHIYMTQTAKKEESQVYDQQQTFEPFFAVVDHPPLLDTQHAALKYFAKENKTFWVKLVRAIEIDESDDVPHPLKKYDHLVRPNTFLYYFRSFMDVYTTKTNQ